jgi:hypothetical protein
VTLLCSLGVSRVIYYFHRHPESSLEIFEKENITCVPFLADENFKEYVVFLRSQVPKKFSSFFPEQRNIEKVILDSAEHTYLEEMYLKKYGKDKVIVLE